MKVLTGHLTATDKKVVKAIFAIGCKSGKQGKSLYFVSEANGIYTVKKQVMDKGLVPCAGSKPRLSAYISTFTI